MQELAKRVFISFIFIPVLILALYFEGIPLYLMFLIVSVFGTQEYICMIRKADIQVPWLWMVFNPLLYSLWVFFPKYEISILWLGILLAILQPLFVWDQARSVLRMFAILFGLIYTCLLYTSDAADE